VEAPPFLILHGLADASVPHGQSVLLYEALQRAGNDVTLRLVERGGVFAVAREFFSRHLQR